MSELGPEIVGQVIDACKEGAGEAAEALGRALDIDELKISVGEPTGIDLHSLPEECAGAGMAAIFIVGDRGAAFILPKSTGMVPDWVDDPDPTGKSKLMTLAQELGMILLPDELMPEDFKTGMVSKITSGIARGKLGPSSQMVPLTLESGSGGSGVGYLIWPLLNPGVMLGATAPPKAEPAAQAAPKPAAQPAAPSPRPAAGPTPGAAAAHQAKTRPAGPKRGLIRVGGNGGYDDLPQYTRSLLKIRVDVSVTLANQEHPVKDILCFGPGSIIQFDKSCEEMLNLDIGGLTIATGEAVKVGEKFGLRVNQITLPEERFHNVGLVREMVGG